ncbi:hypothetical protein Sjap_004687 [Stephania japonica]|uniref:Uncharacterized protein n=1 Tax=Stephania japonica TaxID=461633 RepID=A0AAP0K3Y5_9MAGN
MQNVSWLEEVFSVNSILGGFTSDSPEMDPSSCPIDTTTTMPQSQISWGSLPVDDEENTRRTFLLLKARLRSDPKRVDACRKRMRDIVDQGLLKLQKCEFKQDEVVTDADGLSKEIKKQKKRSWRMQKLTEASDLMDKLNKARTEDDLQSCLQMKSKLFERYDQNCNNDSACMETSEVQTAREDTTPRQDKCHAQPALYVTSVISQPTLDAIEDHFSLSTQIEDL